MSTIKIKDKRYILNFSNTLQLAIIIINLMKYRAIIFLYYLKLVQKRIKKRKRKRGEREKKGEREKLMDSDICFLMFGEVFGKCGKIDRKRSAEIEISTYFSAQDQKLALNL